jgi:hypothetical protein
MASSKTVIHYMNKCYACDNPERAAMYNWRCKCNDPKYLGGSWTPLTQAEYVLRKISDVPGMTRLEIIQCIIDWQYGPGKQTAANVPRGRYSTVFYGWGGYVHNYCQKLADGKWHVTEPIKPGPHGWNRPQTTQASNANNTRSDERSLKQLLNKTVNEWPYSTEAERKYWLSSSLGEQLKQMGLAV